MTMMNLLLYIFILLYAETYIMVKVLIKYNLLKKCFDSLKVFEVLSFNNEK